MKPGEIACPWSHRMIYEEMASKNYKRILILENVAVRDLELMKQAQSIKQFL